MATGPEEKVKQWLIRKIRADWPDAWIYRAPGGRFGRKGVPDLLCCISGIFVAIEVKRDESHDPTKMQRYELELIAKADGISVVMRGKNDVKYSKMKRLIERYESCFKKEV